jgi:transcriptional regulator with XRE-family HTH domain
MREARGLGLREVARRTEIDPSHLSRIERGTAQPTVDALARLARVLGLTELERLLRPYISTEEVIANEPTTRRGSSTTK